MPQSPLQQTSFTLDTSGVAGFFGEDEAVAAMASVHLQAGRRWLGWYNSPGSYRVSKRYGQLARSKLWKGLYPGGEKDEIVLFELGGKVGPPFHASHSGTRLQKTGYFGHLILKKCENIAVPDSEIRGRQTTPVGVTIVNLSKVPPERQRTIPERSFAAVVYAAFPILCSVATIIVCAVYREWYAFAMILLGSLANGLSCLILGSGRIEVNHPKAAGGTPRGDGVLISNREMVIILGDEGAVNVITRGHFSLKFPPWSPPNYHDIGLSAFLLTIQFVLQLLLIPQSSLFGQILFITSLGVSWMYNSYVSSLDREDMQTSLLLGRKVLDLADGAIRKCEMGTQTSMVVFLLFVLAPLDPQALLDELLPNNMVWKRFKTCLIDDLRNESRRLPELPEQGTLMEDMRADGDFMRELAVDVRAGYGEYDKWKAELKNDLIHIVSKEV